MATKVIAVIVAEDTETAAMALKNIAGEITQGNTGANGGGPVYAYEWSAQTTPGGVPEAVSIWDMIG